jgi:hypothetical protein
MKESVWVIEVLDVKSNKWEIYGDIDESAFGTKFEAKEVIRHMRVLQGLIDDTKFRVSKYVREEKP